MKTIGLIGGMSWESTASYYRAINEGVKERLGGLHSAKIALYSLDFADIESRQHQGDWAGTATLLQDAASKVQAAGAELVLICTNTMHKVASDIEAVLDVPLLHIADATAKVLKAKGISKVGLLGTAFTMEQDFYRARLTEGFGIEVLTPPAPERALVHQVIYQELCQGTINPDSKAQYLGIIEALAAQGAEGVILGCTEIGLLVNQADTQVALFDTALIHAQAAVDAALG
ncbi:aspartate/glutamate racemase family protein [Gallaecimonas pentaromativorans]|uniref:aspartate/glutamate racemase family protein n=1 Tax=Gallaecimonas pentaromativorans TaxID=584787 RepID=UPI003A8DF211